MSLNGHEHLKQTEELPGIRKEVEEALRDGGDESLRQASHKIKERFTGALRHALVESTLDVYGLLGSNFMDPLDFAGDYSQGWGNYPYTSPAYYIQSMKRGEVLPAYLYEQQLRIYRDRSRKLCQENEYAICAVENRKNYAVGAEGFQYKAVPAKKERTEGIDALLARTQWVIDHWVEHNDLAEYAKDVMLRLDKDGDAFTRYFPQPSGLVTIRTVEAEHVRAPSANYGPHYSFGIQTDPEDVETREGYWIVTDPVNKGWVPEFVPADEICHIKLNTPRSAKRGLPTFYPCEQLLRIASDLLVGVAKNANHRAKIAMVRTVTGALADAARSMLDELKDVNVMDPNTGQSINVEKFQWGTILTQPDTVKTEFPNANFESGNFEVALAMILRAVAARLVMPEWMLSVDASNSNFSSSMIAEAPSTKAFEDLQEMLLRRFGANRMRSRESMVWYQIRHAVRVGLLPPETLVLVKIECKGPSLVVRDKTGEAQQNTVYYQMRAKSKRIIQMENNWDPEQVDKDFAEEDAENIERQQAMAAVMSQQQPQPGPEAGGGDSGPTAGQQDAIPGVPVEDLNVQSYDEGGQGGQPPAGRVPTREAKETPIPIEEAYNGEFKIHPSQGDGYKIVTPHGYIDYRHRPDDKVNEIWWVESHKKNHGSDLVDLMQKHHPADAIAWGVTSHAGEDLRERWHTKNPKVDSITGPHDGQFDPFGHENEDEDDDEPIEESAWHDIPADVLIGVLVEAVAVPASVPLVEEGPDPQPKPVAYTPTAHKKVRSALEKGIMDDAAAEPLGGGTSGSYKVSLDTGHHAVHKPAAMERSFRSTVPEGEMYKREAAASSVADLAGMHDLVPATVIKDHEHHGVGSLQHFRQGKVARMLPDNDKFGDNARDIARAGTFDYLIGNTDRHSGNWLVSPENKLQLIDHGHSFPTGDEHWSIHSTPHRNQKLHHAAADIEAPIPKEFHKMKWEDVEGALRKHGLGDAEIGHTRHRFNQIQRASHVHQLRHAHTASEDKAAAADEGNAGSPSDFS